MSGLLCGSLFSGVGGMDLGFAWAGWRHAFFAEIEPFGRAVLAERFPDVPIYSDVRDVPECERGEWDRLDVLTFGSPCQDLSVAGKRRGLDGDRSGLFWEAMRIAGDGPLRPRALLMENVEGLLSSNRGRDFALVLDAMAERGYGWSFRVLDSQHFQVPQRRVRVFVLAIADDDPRSERIAEVLALGESSRRDSPTSNPSWPLTSSGAGSGAPGGGGAGDAVTVERERESRSRRHEQVGEGKRGPCRGRVPEPRPRRRVVGAITAQYGEQAGQDLAYGGGLVTSDHEPTAIGFSHTQGLDHQAAEERTPTLRRNGGGWAVGQAATVRRLTPLECERLQGWPDGWTDIPWRGKDHAPDSKRYAAAGNGVTAPVAYWIAARLAEVLGD